MLRECRTVMCGRIRRSIGTMMREANDVLSELALRDGGNVADSPYFDGIRELQLRRREIELRFENRFASLFDDALSQSLGWRTNQGDCGNENPAAAETCAQAGGDEAVSRMRAACRNSLLALDRRISVLLNRDMYPALNPMRPELIYEAFRGVCSGLESGDNIQQVLLGLFERSVALSLDDIYREVDSLLERGARAGGVPAASPPDPEGTGSAPTGEFGRRDESHLMLVESWVASTIQRHIRGRQVPRFVTEFIGRYWRVYLQRIYIQRGQDSPDWDRAVQTLDELVLSVQEHDDPQSRRRMMWLLPGLVYRLKSGMRTISVPVAEQRLFLKTLKTCHVNVVERRAAGKNGGVPG